MKHTRIKIFPCKWSDDDGLKRVEDEINAFIIDKIVVEIIPYYENIMVRYKETY